MALHYGSLSLRRCDEELQVVSRLVGASHLSISWRASLCRRLMKCHSEAYAIHASRGAGR